MTTPNSELVGALAHDQMVVNAAKVSKKKFRSWDQFDDKGERLIRYMMRERHGTPFEHNYFCFRITVPIFAQRDWMRHRVGHSFNEISSRWQDMDELGVYEPEHLRVQIGKPFEYQYEGFNPDESTGLQRLRHWFRRRRLLRSQQKALKRYRWMVDHGYAREQAMAALPMGTYTEFMWSCNARSLMHFLSLRRQANVRKEIRDVCAQIEEEFRAYMPITHAAWADAGYRAP